MPIYIYIQTIALLDTHISEFRTRLRDVRFVIYDHNRYKQIKQIRKGPLGSSPQTYERSPQMKPIRPETSGSSAAKNKSAGGNPFTKLKEWYTGADAKELNLTVSSIVSSI